ncbi:MAG: ATP-binding cassette domain-containing protein [Verrucomicrobia bacterium]|nr:ATP-binding cassette domain-containing protein [Verrucomicrobiota bacterium]MCH8513342.1 ATP-binding cassette domain-containing protein [Kiritimatiellia bacterium]
MSQPQKALISLRGARKTYTMGTHKVHALDGVDLDIQRGEFAAIVGPSGSGKSTLMHMLGCLDRLSTGSYHLAGDDMSTAEDNRLSEIRNRRIGFVFQQFNLLPNLTVLENIALPLAYSGLGRAERLEKARGMAEKVGLGDRTDHKPNELSGGQCQRVAIARALIHSPEVLFADEPTGALDSKTGKEILALLDELHNQGHTILLVTHDPKVANHAHRKITLADGKIVADEIRPDINPPVASEPDPIQNRGNLGFRDMIRMGIREGLMAHKLRTSLTMLGVIIGVASVISMSSFSEGSKLKQANQIRALGANLIRIVDRRLENAALYQARAQGSHGLTRRDAEVLQIALDDITAVAMARDLSVEVLRERQPVGNVRVRGVSGEYLVVNNLSLSAGVGFHPLDEVRQHRVAVIGAGMVPRGQDPASMLDTKLVVGGQPYQIIGVLANKFVDTTELEAVGANDANLDVLVPLRATLTRFTHQPLRSELDEILVQLAEEDRLSEAGRDIRRILDVRHHGVEDYDLIIPLDLLKSKQEAQKLLDILSLSISAISLVVGGIGIMNIMLAAVTERLKEIGIRRAVGARKVDIRRQFLVEAIIISMVGGIAGVLLAAGGVAIAAGPLDFPIVFDPLIVTIAFGASFCTGLLFGAYPAIQASNQNLVEILSRE